MAKRYYIIAGEASGDCHAANMLKALKQKQGDIQLRGWGGDAMQAVGVDLVMHYRDTAMMGIFTILFNLRKLLGFFSLCKQDILSYKPDALILVDYSGFNLRMAAYAKKHNLTVLYYISPKLWAWNRARVKKVQKYVDKMLCIMPFEEDFYRGYGVEVEYVGHPVLDALENYRKIGKKPPASRSWLALIPGSRKGEITQVLPVMLKSLLLLKTTLPVKITCSKGVSLNVYQNIIKQLPSSMQSKIELVEDDYYQTIGGAKVAAVTSGTANLEVMLLGTPQVVCYRISQSWAWWIARTFFIRVKLVSPVNLIGGKEVIKEFLQWKLRPKALAHELRLLLDSSSSRYEQQKKDYEHCCTLLGEQGASQRAADSISKYMNR